ncbi:MAG: Holliday junction resolvase RuvX [Myxococcota bacterium]
MNERGAKLGAGRAVGIDPGRRRVGIAVQDDAGGTLALPHATVERGNDEADAVRKVSAALAAVEVSVLVVGWPLRLDGSEGAEARRARAFAGALAKAVGAPVEMLDERLTTVAAERALGALGVRGQARRRVVDEAAAALLLQGWLDGREARR